jgi:predicted metalloprotease with PDZ domain
MRIFAGVGPMAMHDAVHFDVDLNNAHAHLFRVSLKMANASALQKFSLPAWSPGSYMLRDFAQHIVSIRAFSQGQEIFINKINKNTFTVYNNTSDIELVYDVYGFDSSIRAAFIDDEQAFFNGSALFLRPHGHDKNPFVLTLRPPLSKPDWQLASAMPMLERSTNGFGSFCAQSFDELIDYPFQIGAFKKLSFRALGILHELALVHAPENFDEATLLCDLEKLCTSQLNIFGGKAPFSSYLFIVRCEEGAFGGLEHRNSTMLLITPFGLPKKGVKADANYLSFLSLCSHEYFHVWNVKRLKPKNFIEYDFDNENYTKLLWLSEGVTAYFDDYMVHKAGLMTAESYLDIMAKNYTKLLRNSGRFCQSLADASFDAWLKFYRPNENSQNATVSYYLKGSFLALYLDLSIRLISKSQNSLASLMHDAYLKYPDGIEEEDFLSLVESYGINSADFRSYLYGTADLPLADLLPCFGIEMALLPDESFIDDKAKLPVFLGFKLRFDDNGRALVNFVEKDGPASQASLSPNDEIIAINNIRLDSSNYAELLARIEAGQSASLLFSRKKRIKETRIEAKDLPLRVVKLSLKKEASLEEMKRRDGWLAFLSGALC